MVPVGFFLRAVAELLHSVLYLFIFLMFARMILSWVNPDPSNGIVRFLYSSTEPLLDRVRRYVPPIGMFDLSALIVVLVLFFLDRFLVELLAHYATIMLSGRVTPV